VVAEGTAVVRHHLAPANATQGVAGKSEADDSEDPCRMSSAESAELVKMDVVEGVPEEEGADEQAWDGLQQVAAIGGGTHAGNRVDCRRCVVSREETRG
jgi:hypothetical protein